MIMPLLAAPTHEPTEAQVAAVAASLGETFSPGDVGNFVLAGVPIPYVRRGFNFTDLSRFETKFTFGDYSKDSDNLLSTYVRSTFTGGALIDDHQEGVTDARFRFSTLHTRSPGQLSLLGLDFQAAIDTTADDDDLVYPIGDYDDEYYTVIGLELFRQAATPNTPDDVVSIGTLTGAPVERGTVYKGNLYIPLGGAGLVRTDGATITNVQDSTPADIDTRSLVVWDNKLFALTTAGQLRKFDGTTWTAVADTLTLPTDRVPRKLVWFYDRNGSPTVFIVTDVDLWGWESEADVIHPTRLRIPRHPDNGLACCEWRDDALYYAAGLGVYRYTASGTISAVGLDRDDGLPAQYHGRIIDLIPEHNGLIALIEGVPTQEEVIPDTLYSDHGPFAEDMAVDSGLTQSHNLIMIWNEAGWHTLWAGENDVTMTWLALSQVRIPQADHLLDYGIHFGITDSENIPEDRFLPFPKYFFGPKKLVQQNAFPFRTSGTHWDGRFDAGMQGFSKLASHFEVNIFDPEDGNATEGTVQVWYSTDRFPGFKLLGEASAYGRTVLPFGLNAEGFVEGEAFTWIEFRYELAQGATVTRTPVIDSMVLKFMKLPLEGTSWTVAVPLDWEGEWVGQTAGMIRDHLRSLTTAERFHPMQLVRDGFVYRVRVAQAQGQQPTGSNPQGTVTLSILRIPIPGEASYG
jgi:hypothetical protein